MNGVIIKNVLRNCIDNGNHDAETLAALNDALNEIDSVMKRYAADDRTIFNNDVVIVAPSLFDNLMVEATYNIYGTLAKNNNGTVSFDTYVQAVRNYPAWQSFTDDQLKRTFGFIRDLWSDNNE